jgi:hypothetical protein
MRTDELMTNVEAQMKQVVSNPFCYSVISASFVDIRHSMGLDTLRRTIYTSPTLFPPACPGLTT